MQIMTEPPIKVLVLQLHTDGGATTIRLQSATKLVRDVVDRIQTSVHAVSPLLVIHTTHGIVLQPLALVYAPIVTMAVMSMITPAILSKGIKEHRAMLDIPVSATLAVEVQVEIHKRITRTRKVAAVVLSAITRKRCQILMVTV